MSNIAEGFERGGRREFLRFLTIAKASAGEVESHAFVAIDQQYLAEQEFALLRRQAADTKKLMVGLIHYLRRTIPTKGS